MREITVPNTQVNVSQDTTISSIYKTVDFQQVSCTAKVLSVDEPMQVSGGKNKQDITISDSLADCLGRIYQQTR